MYILLKNLVCSRVSTVITAGIRLFYTIYES